MSDKSKVRFAIVGCGRVSSRHIDAISHVPGAVISAVCDPVPQARESAAELTKAEAFESTQELYARGNFDIVDVATPSGDHFERVMEALLHNKHVLTEKPIALRLEQAKEMSEEAANRGLKLWVAFQNRYNLAIRKARETIESGRLGKVVAGSIRLRWCRRQDYYSQDNWHGTWAMDGGVLSQQAIHHLDALQWLVGPIDSVRADCARQLAKMECEDLAVATVRFKNGARGVIEAMTCARPRDIEASVSILGENGSIVLGGIGMNKIDAFEFDSPQEEDSSVEKYFEDIPNGYGWGHNTLFQRIVDSIQGNGNVEIGGAEAMESLKLLHALYASAELEREVRLSENLQSKYLGLKSEQGRET